MRFVVWDAGCGDYKFAVSGVCIQEVFQINLATMTTINKLAPHINFGTSGVRALVVELTPEVVHAFTTAFINYLRATNQLGSAGRIVLAHDLRPSSPTIASACIAAIQDAGLTAEYAGAVPTPALALRAQTAGSPGIMVTGSHIPFDRNGIKFYTALGEILKADEEGIRSANFDLPDVTRQAYPVSLPLVDGEALRSYRTRYIDFFDSHLLHGWRIGLYEHSSVARDFLRELLATLGADVVELGRSDSFVPIDTEAVSANDRARARAWCQEQGLDAVVSTDGDADRPLVFDEHGECIRGDVIGILTARLLAADAVVTPVSSNTALEKSGWFKRTARTRIGSPYVIEGMQRMVEEGAASVVGYEANGGFLVGARVDVSGKALEALPTRDAVLPVLALFALAASQGTKLSSLPGLLPERHTASDRLRDIPTEISKRLIHDLMTDSVRRDDFFCDIGHVSSVDSTDGYRATLDNGEILHIRPSGNAPELRCYTEASTATRAAFLLNWGLDRVRIALTLARGTR
jgi:phosphomannomutase